MSGIMRRLPIGGHEYVIAFIGQEPGQQLAHRHIVFDDEHAPAG